MAKCSLDIKKDIIDTVGKKMSNLGATVEGNVGFFPNPSRSSNAINSINKEFGSLVVKAGEQGSFFIEPSDALIKEYLDEYNTSFAVTEIGTVFKEPSKFSKEDYDTLIDMGYTEDEILDKLGSKKSSTIITKITREYPENLDFQLEGTEGSKASPETIAKIKEAAKKMGIDIQELAAYAKATGLDSKGINAVADLAKGVIAVATGKEDVALTEEMVHLGFGMLEQTNPKMVTEMIAKIDRFQIYKKTLAEYKDNKNYQLSNGKPDIRKIKIEAIGKLLAEVIVYENEGSTEFPELRLEENQSFLRRMWNRMMDFFSGIYGKSNINIFEEAGAKIIAGEAGTIEDIKSGEIYYQLSPEQSEFNKKREETDNLVKKVYNDEKPDAILLDSEEANNWYEIQQPDGTYARIVNRVTDRVKAWYKKRFPGKIFSKEEEAFNNLKRDYGIAGHADLEEIHSRYYNSDGTRKENPLPRPKKFKLESQAMYDKLETYYIDLIESLKGPNGENPAVYSEVVIYDKKEKEAGTIDFLAIDHTGKAHILDWKFMHIKGDDVAWFKQGAFNIQLGTYKRMLKENYGIKEFGMIRAIPISMEFSKQNPKLKDSKLILSGIAIGSVDKSKLDPIDELYLIPVSEETESTGEKALDEVISNLNALLAQVEKQEATDETDREFKFARMNEIRKAIRIIQGTNNLMPLIDVIETTRKSGEAILNDYNAIYKDRPATSKDSSNKELSLFSEEMQNYLDASKVFGPISDNIGDLIYSESMIKDAKTEAQKEYLANAKLIRENLREESEKIRVTATSLTKAQLEFADKHIGQRNLVTGLTTAEAVVKGLASLFRGVSELPMASLELLTKLTRNAQGNASKESLATVDRLMNIRKKIMERGGDIRSIIQKVYQKDEKGGIVNKLIYKYQKEFNETVDKKAEEGGDRQWLLQNIDVEGYKKEADELIKTQIDKINKLQYPGSQQEVENRINTEIQLVKDKYDLDSKNFNGWNNYVIKRHPLEKWQSKEYLDVKKDADLFELYTLINEINSEAKDSGYISGMVSKTFLPFIRKNIAEELAWNNSLTVMSKFADKVSDSLKLQAGEVGYGNINQITGELENSIPKYYTYDFTYKDGVNDYSDVSEDIFKNMILYVQQLNKYKYLSEIEGQLKLVKNVEEIKGHLKTDKSGNVIRVDGIIKPEKGNEANLKIYDDFLRTLLYDQKYVLSDADTPILKGIREGINKLVGKEVFKLNDEASPKSLIKTIDAVNRGFRMKALGLNLISGAVNIFGANIQVATQAGNYFKAREVAKNEKKLLSQSFDSDEDKKMFAELMNTFMPLKDDPATEEYKKAGMSKFTNVNLGDMLMVFFREPEILMEKSIFLTLLQNSMIENGKIVNIREFVKSKYKDRYSSGSNYSEIKKKMDTEVEELKRTRSIDAIKKLENGKLVIPGLDLTDQTEIQRLTNLSRTIARNATGGMSDGDKNRMALSVWTNSMMVFKGWIPKLMDTRFSEFRKVSDDFSVTIDNEGVSQGQKYDVGRIRLFGGVLMNMIHDKSFHLVNILSVNEKGIAQLDKMYEEYAKKYEDSTGKKLTMTPEDFKDMIINNLRNQLKEFGILASMIGVMLSLGFIAPDDDDDKATKNAHRFAQKVVDKFIGELSFFYNPLEIEKLLEGGMFPAIGLVSDFTKFTNNFMAEVTGQDFSVSTNTPEEVRKKAQPIKYAMKMAPVTTQLVTWLSIISSDFAEEFDVTIPAKSGIK
jgi:hypothetical protein